MREKHYRMVYQGMDSELRYAANDHYQRKHGKKWTDNPSDTVCRIYSESTIESKRIFAGIKRFTQGMDIPLNEWVFVETISTSHHFGGKRKHARTVDLDIDELTDAIIATRSPTCRT